MRIIALFAIAFLSSTGAHAKGVRVSFDPADPQTGPFPTDALTIVDLHQKTGLRVNLPLPAECGATAARPICAELAMINQFDGFAVQPRIRVRFSGSINPETLRGGIYLLWLEKLSDDEYGMGQAGRISLINEVVYDPATNTAYAKPDDALDQSRRYALVVTNDIKDTAGDPIDSSDTTAYCNENGRYCSQLTQAMSLASSVLRAPRRVVGGSVFTTMSATAFMESARRSLLTINPSFTRTGPKSTFTVPEIGSIVLHEQTAATGDKKFTDIPFPVDPAVLAQFGLGSIAFGSYHSGRFIGPSFRIDAPPTGEAVPTPAQDEEIFFQVYLPSSPKPADGYPVAIVGHGFGGTRLDASTAMIPGLVGSGMAVIAINALGHGGGPEGTIAITERDGTVITLPFGGRGADLNGDGAIAAVEGAVFFAPQQPIGIRDALRQTALDLSQLTRAIQMGMDLDADGTVDLSTTQITYLGVSLGSFYGSLLSAIEPGVSAAVLNVGGGSGVDAAVWSPSFRPLLQAYLAAGLLLNKGTDFDANLPLRYEPVRVNQVPGAIAIQDVIERLEWIETPGAPHAYAPHFKSTTLPDVPIKRTLFQFAIGDMTVPNPVNVQLLRTANMWETAVMYRPADPKRNPHGFIAQSDTVTAAAIALEAQRQAAQFLLGTDETVPAMAPAVQRFFQPATHELERLNY